MAKRRNPSMQAPEPRSKESKAEVELRAFRAQQELDAEREQQKLAEEAEAQAIKDLELPDLEFDWSDLGWGESEDLSDALAAVGDAEREVDEDGNRISREERREMMDEAFSELRHWLSRVTVSVPIEWFKRSVREELAGVDPDLTDPDTFIGLQKIRVGRLMNAMNTSRRNSTKN